MTERYWPEWKVYLIGKLIHHPDDLLTAERFVFQEPDVYQLPILRSAKELSDGGLIETQHIHFNKASIDDGRSEYKEKLRISRLTEHASWLGGGSTDSGQPLKAPRDHGLGVLLEKVRYGKELTIAEMLELAEGISRGVSPHRLKQHLTFEMRVKKEKAREMLDGYLEDFIKGDLTTGTPNEPDCYEKQRDLFWEAYRRKSSTKGDKQALKLTEIYSRPDTPGRARFWELVFTLEAEKYITINNFGYFGTYKVQEDNPWIISRDEPFVRFQALQRLIDYRPNPNSDLGQKIAEIAQRLKAARTAEPPMAQFNAIQAERSVKALWAESDKILPQPHLEKVEEGKIEAQFLGLVLSNCELSYEKGGKPSHKWRSHCKQIAVLYELMTKLDGVPAKILLGTIWNLPPSGKNYGILSRTIDHLQGILVKLGCQQKAGTKREIKIIKDGEGSTAVYKIINRNPELASRLSPITQTVS